MSRSQILLFGIQEIIIPGDKRSTVQSDRTDEGRQREGEGLRSQHRILMAPEQRRDEPAKSGVEMEIDKGNKKPNKREEKHGLGKYLRKHCCNVEMRKDEGERVERPGLT